MLSKVWRKGPGHYDTIFVNTDPSFDGMQGLEVARVCLFFSFSHEGIEYPCALVHWFSCVGGLWENIGMWVVELDISDNGKTINHYHSPQYNCSSITPPSSICVENMFQRFLLFTDTLNTFTRFYVNKYTDHHAFEIAFWYFWIFAWGAYICTWYPYFSMLRWNYCVHLRTTCTYHVLHLFLTYLLGWALQPLGTTYDVLRLLPTLTNLTL